MARRRGRSLRTGITPATRSNASAVAVAAVLATMPTHQRPAVGAAHILPSPTRRSHLQTPLLLRLVLPVLAALRARPQAERAATVRFRIIQIQETSASQRAERAGRAATSMAQVEHQRQERAPPKIPAAMAVLPLTAVGLVLAVVALPGRMEEVQRVGLLQL